jgi:CDP-6-deoxy-D-xylo-4-hexulose-3-dehydrase
MSDGYRIHYAKATYDEKERAAVNDVLDHPERLVGGPYTEDFESRISSLFGKEHGVMVNSGSSANFLAVEVLDLEPGAEVITPLTTFSTTISPLVKNDLLPVFVDIDIGSYQLDIDQVEKAITDNTEAIMVPSLIGNVPDYPRLQNIASEYDLHLIEDSADTLGATIDGVPTGKFTDVSTTSFYGSHIITTLGSGGMVSVDCKDWSNRLKKLRGWGRRSAADETDDIEARLSTDLDGTPYDSKFIFDEIGYNFLPTEASAAFGIEQVEKLPEFRRRRQQNFEELRQFITEYEEWFILPKQRGAVDTCWLAFPLTIKDGAPFSRKTLVKHLEENGIQTRSLWTGNILKHPGFENIDARLPFSEYTNTEKVMRDSFVVGIHQSIDSDSLAYLKDTLRSFLE